MKKCKCGNCVRVVENVIDDTYLIKIYCNKCGNLSPVLYTKIGNKDSFKRNVLRRWDNEQL